MNIKMYRRFITLFVVTLVFSLLLGNALAQKKPVYVRQGGELLFTFHVSAFGKTPQQRANSVFDRLRWILNKRIRPSQIRAVPEKGGVNWRVVAGDRYVVRVSPADGKAEKSTAKALAIDWAENLKVVLPKLNAQPNRMQRTLEAEGSRRKR